MFHLSRSCCRDQGSKTEARFGRSRHRPTNQTNVSEFMKFNLATLEVANKSLPLLATLFADTEARTCTRIFELVASLQYDSNTGSIADSCIISQHFRRRWNLNTSHNFATKMILFSMVHKTSTCQLQISIVQAFSISDALLAGKTHVR